MATGYDNRQPTRGSFAFNPAAPVQGRGNASGQSAGVQLVGGETKSGFVGAGPQTTDLAPSTIPDFLNKLLEPQIKAKQQSRLIDGYIAAAGGASEESLKKEGGGINSIFGHSMYRQGAALYQGVDAAGKAQGEFLGNIDELAKLPQSEVGPAVARMMQAARTGNRLSDAVADEQMMNGMSPLIDLVTKRRVLHEQTTAANNLGSAWATSSDNYQRQMSGLAGLATDEANAASINTLNNDYRGLRVKPAGMLDETYKAALKVDFERNLDSGNGYAVEAMVSEGILNAVDGPERQRLEAKIDKAAANSFSTVAMNPEVNRQLATLDAAITNGKVSSAKEIYDRAQEINTAVARFTGFKAPMITASDIQAMQKDYTNGEFAAGLRVQTRQYQIEDRDAERAYTEDKKAAEDAATQAAVDAAWATGNGGRAAAMGVGKSENHNFTALGLWQSNNMKGIAKNFDQSMKVNDAVADEAKAPILSSLRVGYTNSFKGGYEKWKALRTESPAAAAAYFGDNDKSLERFDRAVRGGTAPVEAWALAFGEGTQSVRMDLPEGTKRDAVISAVSASMTKDDKWMMGMAGSRVPLNTSSRNRMSTDMLPEVADYMRATGLSVEAASERVYAKALSSGRLERVGAFGWVNPPNTKPLATLLGVPDQEADLVVMDYVDTELRKAGFSGGADGEEYTVVRMADQGGKAAMFIHAFGAAGEGDDRAIWLTSDQLKAHQRNRVTAEVAGNAPDPALAAARASAKAGLDPNRRIPGEKGWARVKRINLETRARSLPAKPVAVVPAIIKGVAKAIPSVTYKTTQRKLKFNW